MNKLALANINNNVPINIQIVATEGNHISIQVYIMISITIHICITNHICIVMILFRRQSILLPVSHLSPSDLTLWCLVSSDRLFIMNYNIIIFPTVRPHHSWWSDMKCKCLFICHIQGPADTEEKKNLLYFQCNKPHTCSYVVFASSLASYHHDKSQQNNEVNKYCAHTNTDTLTLITWFTPMLLCREIYVVIYLITPIRVYYLTT